MTKEIKPSKIIEYNRAIAELMPLKLPYKAARDIMRLHDAITAELNMITKQEKDWIYECHGRINQSGNVEFENPDDSVRYGEWRRDLLDTVITVDLPPCDLSAYIDSLSLSASAISVLNGVVTFDHDTGTDSH